MAQMGYIRGSSLGTRGGGITRPVAIEIFPKSVGLDYCRNPEEGLDKARRAAVAQRRKARKLRQQVEARADQAREAALSNEVAKKNFFEVINTLGDSSGRRGGAPRDGGGMDLLSGPFKSVEVKVRSLRFMCFFACVSLSQPSCPVLYFI
jgi:hypothetical protein